MEEMIFKLIGQLGFPIFVAVFLLIRLGKTQETMVQALQSMEAKFDRLFDALERLLKRCEECDHKRSSKNGV